LNADWTGVKFEVGCDRSCSHVSFLRHYRIPNIIEMTDLSLVKDNALLEFTAIADKDIVSKEDVSSDVGSFSQFTIFADDCWAFDHSSMLDDCSLANEYIAVNMD
jgi:hypothetical protein